MKAPQIDETTNAVATNKCLVSSSWRVTAVGQHKRSIIIVDHFRLELPYQLHVTSDPASASHECTQGCHNLLAASLSLSSLHQPRNLLSINVSSTIDTT